MRSTVVEVDWDGARDLGPVARAVVDELGASPGAVVAAAQWVGDRYQLGIGAAGRLWNDATAPSVSVDTPFDLASLTKPATALTWARLEARGRVRREASLAAFLPELATTASAQTPLDLLMAHRAGLEAHIEFFVKESGAAQPRKADTLRRAADARRPGCDGPAVGEGFAPIYSDLGYILTGAAIERATDQPLDAVVDAEVATPLGLRMGSIRRLVGREPGLASAVAATETVAWRGGRLQAIVHDENAWVLAGEGSAGHAGMFGDARAVVGLGCALLDALHRRADAWLDVEALHPLVRRRPGGSHAAGFDRRSPPSESGPQPSSGTRFGPATFGHLGFTGTSLWIDPDAQRVGVLLTNRVCPTREHIVIRQARPVAYDALVAAMENP